LQANDAEVAAHHRQAQGPFCGVGFTLEDCAAPVISLLPGRVALGMGRVSSSKELLGCNVYHVTVTGVVPVQLGEMT